MFKKNDLVELENGSRLFVQTVSEKTLGLSPSLNGLDVITEQIDSCFLVSRPKSDMLVELLNKFNKTRNYGPMPYNADLTGYADDTAFTGIIIQGLTDHRTLHFNGLLWNTYRDLQNFIESIGLDNILSTYNNGIFCLDAERFNEQGFLKHSSCSLLGDLDENEFSFFVNEIEKAYNTTRILNFFEKYKSDMIIKPIILCYGFTDKKSQ